MSNHINRTVSTFHNQRHPNHPHINRDAMEPSPSPSPTQAQSSEMVIDLAVAIIGGGLSGLYTATLLEKTSPDQAYQLFEAKPKTGGRVLSLPSASGAHRHDLGPTWVWPHHTRMHNLLKSHQLATLAQEDSGDKLLQYARGCTERLPGDENQARRVQGGMSNVTDALARPLSARIQTGRVLRRIERQDAMWRLSFCGASAQTVLAERVVLAVPPRVALQVDGMRDVLPPALARHLGKVQTWMAGQMKVVFEYRRPFWRDMGLSGAAMCAKSVSDGVIGELFDASVGDMGALMTFVHAQEARLYGDDLEQVAVEQLVDLFGEQARAVVKVWKHDWAADEFVATSKDVNVNIRHPVFKMEIWEQQLQQMGLMFAGTEVAEREAGYLEGALIAAERAAQFAAARDAGVERSIGTGTRVML